MLSLLCFHLSFNHRTQSYNNFNLLKLLDFVFIWEGEKYVCEVSLRGKCNKKGRLTPSYYSQITLAAAVSYKANNANSILSMLIDCTNVQETFTKISKENCPSLRQWSYWIYFGLAIASGALMLCSFFWPISAREWRNRASNNKYMGPPPYASRPIGVWDPCSKLRRPFFLFFSFMWRCSGDATIKAECSQKHLNLKIIIIIIKFFYLFTLKKN